MEQMTFDINQDEWVEFNGTNFPSKSGDYLVTVKADKFNHDIFLVFFSPKQDGFVALSGKESKDEFLAVGWTETWDVTDEVIAWKELPPPYAKEKENE